MGWKNIPHFAPGSFSPERMLTFLTYSTIQERRPIRLRIFSYIKNGKKNFLFLKLNAMRHNIIVIQVLDRVYNVTFLA
jgi:hypothetical protein